ncbi:hypothetical protein FHS72_003670 [Loktanella ponticola]|uniref:Uncharacterized protein n=1 Tax=Yoonia ponticola TaxID=1524255 RepID=A0A7W9BP86_9RHOB|nr:hypothetical protein [Yoonia ponticola]
MHTHGLSEFGGKPPKPPTCKSLFPQNTGGYDPQFPGLRPPLTEQFHHALYRYVKKVWET